MSRITIGSMKTYQTEVAATHLGKGWLSTLVALAAILFLPACKEDFGDAGIGVLPQSELVEIQYNDTTTLLLSTQWVDSINTLNSIRQLFGNYIDPEFGNISAQTYFEISPGEGLTFGNAANLKFDSLVLFLDAESYYGRTETPQRLHVHEIMESIPDTGSLYSSRSLAYYPKDLALNNPEIKNLSSSGAVVRVRLDDALGEKILFGDPDSLADDSLFRKMFKGLRISTDPVEYLSREPGAIYRLFAQTEIAGNVANSGATSIRIYYQIKTDTSDYEAKSVLLSANAGNKYTAIQRTDFETRTLLSQHLFSPDTDSIYEFLEAGVLIKGKLEMPGLSNLPKVGLLRALLILPVATEYLGSSSRFRPPSEIQLAVLDSTGAEVLIAGNNQLAHSSAIIYNSVSGDYAVDISSYVQAILIGRQPNYGLTIYPVSRSSSINRVILHGTSNPGAKPVLRLTYTTLPK